MQSYKTSKSTKRLQHFPRNGLAFDQLTKAEQKDLETTEYSKIERKTIIQFHVAMVAGYARLASCTDTAIWVLSVLSAVYKIFVNLCNLRCVTQTICG